jgi:hypothetical protein
MLCKLLYELKVINYKLHVNMKKPNQEMDLFTAAVELLKSGFVPESRVSHASVYAGSLLEGSRSKAR